MLAEKEEKLSAKAFLPALGDHYLIRELVEFGVTHNESLPEGLQDVADTLTPKFVGTCTILFTFCFIVSVVLINHGNGLIGIDWVRSKPIVACA
ncbi:hypothetical protein TELCIR_25776, partial [Teladorsagia circumcincta]